MLVILTNSVVFRKLFAELIGLLVTLLDVADGCLSIHIEDTLDHLLLLVGRFVVLLLLLCAFGCFGLGGVALLFLRLFVVLLVVFVIV